MPAEMSRDIYFGTCVTIITLLDLFFIWLWRTS